MHWPFSYRHCWCPPRLVLVAAEPEAAEEPVRGSGGEAAGRRRELDRGPRRAGQCKVKERQCKVKERQCKIKERQCKVKERQWKVKERQCKV